MKPKKQIQPIDIRQFWVAENPMLAAVYSVGDMVITKYDVFSDDEYDKAGAKNVGKEKYVVTKVEWWPQGEGYLVYGERSDKRNCQVWHQEVDLKLVAKNGG